MHRAIGMLAAIAAAALWTSALALEPTPLEAFSRSGQVFLTWPAAAGDVVRYDVYRASAPITQPQLVKELVPVQFVTPGSGRDSYVPSKERRNPDYRAPMQTIVPGGPLPETTELAVLTSDAPGTFYHAVTAIDADGAIVQLYAGERSIDETPGMPAPMLGSVTYDETRKFYRHDFVHWATPHMSHQPGITFHFAILSLQDTLDFASPVRLAVGLYGKGGDYRDMAYPSPERDQIVLIPSNYHPVLREVTHGNSWWAGYVPGAVDPESHDAAFHFYDHFRLKYYMDWLFRNVNIDPNRVWMHGGSMGGMGALNFAMEYPDMFASIEVLVPVVAPQRTQPSLFKDFPILLGTGESLWENLRRISPLSRLNEGYSLPPTLIRYGLSDSATAYEDMQAFLHAIEARGLISYAISSESGHDFDPAKALSPPKLPRDRQPVIGMSNVREFQGGAFRASLPMPRNTRARYPSNYIAYLRSAGADTVTFFFRRLPGGGVDSPANSIRGIADVTIARLHGFNLDPRGRFVCFDDRKREIATTITTDPHANTITIHALPFSEGVTYSVALLETLAPVE